MTGQSEEPRSESEILIRRFQQGEREAFDRLMALYTDKVFSLAWGVLRNREDAIDAAQEVFIRMHAALPHFKASDNLGAWLYRVCLNYCIDQKRRAKAPRVDLSDEDWERLQGSARDDPAFLAQQSETGRLVHKAVDELPGRQKMVFIMRHYNLLSLNEIAQTIGCSTGAVKAHLSRATAKLRDRLKGQICPGSAEVGGDELQTD